MISSIDNTTDREFFCEKENCFYYVTLIVNDIDSVAFFVGTQSFFVSSDFLHALRFENSIKKSEVVSLKLNLQNTTGNGLQTYFEPFGEDSEYKMVCEGKQDSEFQNDLSIAHLQGVVSQFIGSKYLEKHLLEHKLSVDFMMKDTEKAGAFTFLLFENEAKLPMIIQ